jgi:hypothetical protein
MIYRVFKIYLLDFQGFNSSNSRKSMLFEHKPELRKIINNSEA